MFVSDKTKIVYFLLRYLSLPVHQPGIVLVMSVHMPVCVCPFIKNPDTTEPENDNLLEI